MNNILEQLRRNNSIHIYSVNDNEFNRYGRVIDFPTKEFLADAVRKTEVPEKGNTYLASYAPFENEDTVSDMAPFFCAMDVQIGLCNGNNNFLGAMEWHDCNELNIGGTDAVLFLGRIEDMDKDHKFDTKDAKAFFLPKDQAVVVTAGTLHFAPCEVTKEGFKVIIGLEKNTNTPLSEKTKEVINSSSDEICKLITMRNKYLICHPERADLVKKGTKALITGTNFEIKTI